MAANYNGPEPPSLCPLGHPLLFYTLGGKSSGKQLLLDAEAPASLPTDDSPGIVLLPPLRFYTHFAHRCPEPHKL